jgi:hypothetical protein
MQLPAIELVATLHRRMSYISGALVILVAAVASIFFIPQITLRGRGPGQNLEKATEELSPAGPVTREAPATSAD